MSHSISSNASTACVRPHHLLLGESFDDAYGRVPWCGDVLVHGEWGTVRLQGVELGRTTILLGGEWRLAPEQNVTLELELDCVRIFVVASVEWSASVGDCGVSGLRLSVTSPEGNDRIAKLVRESQTITAPERPTVIEPQGIDDQETVVARRPVEAPVELETVIRLVNRRRPQVCAAA